MGWSEPPSRQLKMTSLPPMVITTAHERALFALHSPMRVLLATCCLYPNLELLTCLTHPAGTAQSGAYGGADQLIGTDARSQ